eukprot:scaffold5.g785.t1
MRPADLLRLQQGEGGRRVENRISQQRLLSLEFSSCKAIKSAHGGGVTGLDLDLVESRYLLAGAADASVAIYDTQSPTPPDAAPPAAQAAAAGQRQERARPGGGGGGEEHAALAMVTKHSPGGHRFSVSCVAWYPVDTGLFVTGSYDKEVKVWDSNALAPACAFALPARVHGLAMSPVSTAHCLVAVGCAEPQVVLCDVTSGTAVHTLSGHTGGVWALAWSLTSEWELLSGGCDGQLRLWDVRRAGTIHVFDQHQTQAPPPRARRRTQRQQQQQEQEPHGEEPQEAAAGQRQGAQRGQPIGMPRRKKRGERPGTGSGSRGDAAGGSGTASAGAPGASEAMFLPDRMVRYALAHGGNVTGVVPTPDGLFWLSAGTDDTVRLWDGATRRNMLVHYPGAFNRASKARQLAVSHDASTLFHPSGSAVQCFDVQSGALRRTLGGGHFDSINACKWNSMAEELYTGGNDSHIVVWAPAPEGVTAERADGGGGSGESSADEWSD